MKKSKSCEDCGAETARRRSCDECFLRVCGACWSGGAETGFGHQWCGPDKGGPLHALGRKTAAGRGARSFGDAERAALALARAERN